MSLDLDIGSALLSEYDGDDFPGVQIQEYGGDLATCPTMEMHAPYGIYHRPLDPDVDGDGKAIETAAAQVLYAWEGSRPHAWVMEDPRIVKLLPRLLKGETLFYGPTSNFVRCHADGRVTMYTTDDGTPNGKTIARYVSPDPLIGGIVDVCPWGNVKLNSTGYHLVLTSGAEIHAGGVGGIPGADAIVKSYFRFEADSVALNAQAVTLGPGPAYEPAVKAVTLQAYLGAVQSILALISTTLASAIPTSGILPAALLLAMSNFTTVAMPLLGQIGASSVNVS